MITDARRMCALLVGLPERVQILGLVDLASFGQPMRLVWIKQRWRCSTCGRSVTERDPEIGSPRCAMTTRAAKTATLQVGRHGRSVSEVATDLGCDWHTVMNAVVMFGTPLVEDPNRIGAVTAIGLGETLFARVGRFRKRLWSTQIVDVGRVSYSMSLRAVTHQVQCVGCTAGLSLGVTRFCGPRWTWPRRIGPSTTRSSQARHKSLTRSMSCASPTSVSTRCAGVSRTRRSGMGAARTTRSIALAVGCCSPARNSHPARQNTSWVSCALANGSEVGYAYSAKEVVRQIYEHTDIELAEQWLDEIIVDFTDSSTPTEVRRLGRTIRKWRDQILAWHSSHVSNGPTEAVNNFCLLYTSPSPRDRQKSRMPSSA